ncbi:MAG: DUF4198 domain-containing protein [Planctomycetota bacterium]|nr:DUF4198 domain-containing protein [Planctomycetota bacterium]MDA1212789.1 DUF4198 domain-containing protein [Planctomycetota bacterium]
MIKSALISVGVVSVLVLGQLHAHDTWVQTNTNLVRIGDGVHIDLVLGNHGNDHRDFKIAGKLGIEKAVLKVHAPNGSAYDVKDRLADLGYAPKEGFWSTKFVAAEPGLYLVEHVVDQVVNHGMPVRSVKSGKTCFVVSKSLDDVPPSHPGFDQPLGHPLEIVPIANPVTPMGPDVAIRVQVLYKGKPLPDSRVSFIPRGATLAEGFDENFERRTTENGTASFTPREGNYYLVVVHHKTDEKGDDYESTSYAATLTVFVPDVCPCCGE